MIPLLTERLILRDWREEDRAPFAAMNADPQVMRFFPETLTEAESNKIVDRLKASYAETGMTFFATEEQATGRFVGLIGLRQVPQHLPIAPVVELGWRLIADVWGRGYAPEAARALLQIGFEEFDQELLVAYTTPPNAPSRRVMEKIGMVRDKDRDFDHPELPADHPMRRHVVYSIDRDIWRKTKSGTGGR